MHQFFDFAHSVPSHNLTVSAPSLDFSLRSYGLNMTDNAKMEVEKFYERAYSRPEFLDIYIHHRERTYRRIETLVKQLGVEFVVDVGCSVGNLVEILNVSGVTAYGIDLDIPQLRAQHAKLRAADKFRYGDDGMSDVSVPREASATVYLDTLRFMSMPYPSNTEYVIVKEVCSGPWSRWLRRDQEDLRLRSPQSLTKEFPGYTINRLWPTRDLFELQRPGWFGQRIVNQLPTYIAVLRRT